MSAQTILYLNFTIKNGVIKKECDKSRLAEYLKDQKCENLTKRKTRKVKK